MNILILTFCGAAFGAGEDPSFSFSVDEQIWADTTTPFAVDAEGTRGGQELHWQNRLWNDLAIETDTLKVKLGLELLSGQFSGDTTDIHPWIDQRGRSTNQVKLAKVDQLSIRANLDSAQIEAGLVRSHWGLGMLANDGRHDPMFGHTNFGDRVLRARITTKAAPNSPWHFTAAVDRVVEDDLTIDASLQWTQQSILSVLYAEKDIQWGVYGVARHQTELYNSRETRVGVLDAFADVYTDISSGLQLQTAFEAAGISGKTNRSTTYGSPDRVHIRSAGATGIVNLIFQEKQRLGVAGGWASGDGDSADDVSNDFTFDRDFGVGMVLFKEIMGGVEEATYTLLTDPIYAGQAPDGVEASVNEGAFRRATYVQPQTSIMATQWLELRAAALFAWATAPVNQAFYTHRNGGVPVNHHGVPTNGYALGTELDWGVVIGDRPISKKIKVRPSLSIQGGHAFIGTALQGPGQEDQVDRYIVAIRIR